MSEPEIQNNPMEPEYRSKSMKPMLDDLYYVYYIRITKQNQRLEAAVEAPKRSSSCRFLEVRAMMWMSGMTLQQFIRSLIRSLTQSLIQHDRQRKTLQQLSQQTLHQPYERASAWRDCD